MRFENCLVVSRHELLPLQKKDVEALCEKWEQRAELPTNPVQVRELVRNYKAVIGNLPPNLAAEVNNASVPYLTFDMNSLGVFSNAEEVEKLKQKYGPDAVVVLPPSKEGEKYRALLYLGVSEVEIKIERKPVIQHDWFGQYAAQINQ